jgi:hypothetical protein
MNQMRKGQIEKVEKGSVSERVKFVHQRFIFQSTVGTTPPPTVDQELCQCLPLPDSWDSI